MPAGFTPASGGKVRAYCSRGERTTPRVSEARALEALESEHGYSTGTCGLCERDRSDIDLTRARRYDHLEILTDPVNGDQILVCRTDQEGCRARAEQRQVQLDRRARGHDAPWPPHPPTLRVLPGGAR
jgi:hypothetical protein